MTIKELEKKFNRFKKDIAFVFFTGISGWLLFILGLSLQNICQRIGVMCLLISGLCFGVNIGKKIIMIKRIYVGVK